MASSTGSATGGTDWLLHQPTQRHSRWKEVQKKLSYRALAVKLSQIKSLSDLYVLKSVCEDAERRGKPFSAILLVVHQTAK
jgi:hypothetical protein